MNLKEQLREALAPHIEPLQQRWEQMSRTDQLVWSGLIAVSTVVILIFGIWLPSHRAQVLAREQYEGNQSLLAYIQANSSQVQAGGAVGSTSEPLLSAISNSAASNGFTLRRFEPEGDRVHIWLDGVPFNKVASWLDQLSKQGINTISAEMERGQDSGQVTVNVTLSR